MTRHPYRHGSVPQQRLFQMFFLILGMLATAPPLLAQAVAEPAVETKHRAAQVRHELLHSTKGVVLVIAHRGDWRNAPENSLQAIRNGIRLGADIVEIDLRETKDGHFVLMHDKTVNRTTNGKGKVSDLTLDQIKRLRLLNGVGTVTDHEVPKLEEALEVARTKIMLNLDKSYDIFREVHQILVRMDMLEHILMKGPHTAEKLEADYGDIIDDVIFMPVVGFEKPGSTALINSYLKGTPPPAFELVFAKETPALNGQINRIKTQGARLWINALAGDECANHQDDVAVHNPDQAYGWILRTGFDMIQTDRPEMLINYLKSEDRRWSPRQK